MTPGSAESPTEPGPSKADSGRQAGRDQVDAVNRLFEEFAFAYHNQYRKAFPNRATLDRAKKFWLGHLRCFSPAQIVRASAKLVTSSEFMPTLSDVVNACHDDRALFGLPSNRAAYQEACLKPGPKAAREWSHEAVYLAGRATGWQLLASEPESVSYPLFEYHYLDLCRQVVEGAKLTIERPPPLPRQTHTELTRKELQELAAELRRELAE